jgi:putative peptide zinc metalloprotease protein
MNISEALNVALPEVPALSKKPKRLPKLRRDLIVREQIEEGKPVTLVLVPELHLYFTLTPAQWGILQLFDGQRTYAEIAELYAAQTGFQVSEEFVRELAENSPDAEFWYRSPQEKNITLFEKLKEERRGRVKRKSKWGDLSEVMFSAWDPDKYLTKLYSKLSFVFSRWFVLLNLLMFAFTAYIFVTHWGEIGRDNLELYNFSNKSFWEIVEFWLLVLVISFVHETAHGLGCKHTGGESHRMGVLLIYLSPAVFCDTTEALVYGNKWQRATTTVAGIWSTMIICSIATFIWWATAVGSPTHNFAYMLMLVSGVLPVLINLNPLIKLDGYFLFTEVFEISELKENSTAYVGAWVRRHIFGLPVEVPYVPPRRRLLYVPYTILSGFYSYGLLYLVVRLVYNIAHHYSPEWAFVPALFMAWVVFKRRVLTFGRFMKMVYLDKRDRLLAALTLPRRIALAATGMVLVFTPLWRQTVEVRFLLEPVQRAVVRTQVPGTVASISAREGQWVTAGTPLIRLSNLALASEAARVNSDWRLASARATEAQLRYVGYGPAEREREKFAERNRLLQDELARLTVSSPISGRVLTPRISDLLGSYLPAGTQVMEIADLSSLRARAYVPGLDIRDVREGAPAALRLDGMTGTLHGNVASLAPASSEIAAGLVAKDSYTGMVAPQYYVATILIPNTQQMLQDGMIGTAKIFVRRRSLASFAGKMIYDFARRKLW